jgi:RimJ/RimL family protein N-acetyltransferase
MNRFETARLRFRSFQEKDLDALAAIQAEPETVRHVGDGRPLDRETVARWIAVSRDNVSRHGYGTGAVIARDGGVLVGWAGIARPGDGSEEFAYGLGRAWQGRGLGRELLRGLVRWARDELRLPALRATVHADNGRSRALLEAEGFVLVDAARGGDPLDLLYVLQTPSRGIE